MIDIGGTHVKVLATGHRTPREIPSGPAMTPRDMVAEVKRLTASWSYDVVSIGYPGVVVHGHPISEPHNLARGWVGFDARRAFGRPVRVINDAAMQALGSYEGGRMLFLGLGTGVGSALIVDHVLVTLELGDLHFDEASVSEIIGRRALEK
ncbi:MAG: ROK family protein, partial [Thermoleophilaceae bacterium]